MNCSDFYIATLLIDEKVNSEKQSMLIPSMVVRVGYQFDWLWVYPRNCWRMLQSVSGLSRKHDRRIYCWYLVTSILVLSSYSDTSWYELNSFAYPCPSALMFLLWNQMTTDWNFPNCDLTSLYFLTGIVASNRKAD